MSSAQKLILSWRNQTSPQLSVVSSLPQAPPALPAIGGSQHQPSCYHLFVLHVSEGIWPKSWKQNKNFVQMPKVRTSTNGLYWPAEMLAMLYNCIFAHQFPRRTKAAMQIFLLRSGSCLPSPASHSLIKLLFFIWLVPKRLFCHKVL